MNYIQFIKKLSSENAHQVFFNSNNEKALSVFIELFERSRTEIKIYAGQLCNDEVSNDPKYIIAISNFIERGGRVRIILNNYDADRALNSPLFRRLALYKSEGKDIVVKSAKGRLVSTLDDNKNEIHFCVADNISYRLETNINERTAQCDFNAPELSQALSDIYDSIFEKETSVEVDLVKLFCF